jgi:hypothetical protein
MKRLTSPLGRADHAARRKRWSEKSAVTKRAQTQKVSLAPVPSLDAGDRVGSHGGSSEADVQARSEVRGPSC